MNANMKKTLIALAVAALFGSSMAYAQDQQDNGQHTTSVQIHKQVSLKSDVDVQGDVDLQGQIQVNAAAIAISDNTQNIHDNLVGNFSQTSNNSSISGNVGDNISGNVGVNAAAGDNNAQANSAAIAAAGTATASSDADFAFGTKCQNNCGNDPQAGGMADAESFAQQTGQRNWTGNAGTTNSASISGSAFDHASGNIGVNVASGDNNEQLNSLAAATTQDNVYALATSTADQQSNDNATLNGSGWLFCDTDLQATSNNASLSGDAFANASGNIGVNVAAGTGNLQSNSLAMAVAGK